MTKTKNSADKDKTELEETLKDNFLDLCIKVHNLSRDNSFLLTRLIFDLAEKSKIYHEEYTPSEIDYIETLEHLQILLDEVISDSNMVTH